MIIRVLFFCSVLVSFTHLSAQKKQDKDSTLINIRQKLLRRKPPEDWLEKTDSFRVMRLMIGGNIYQTEGHNRDAYDSISGRYDFKGELKYVQPIFNLGDISIANLRTSFADDAHNMFSSPDEFALVLKYAGINVLMHANMNTANIDRAMLKRTRSRLNDFDMYHAGAYTDMAERLGNYPLIVTKRGVKVAILNYTDFQAHTPGNRDFVINELDSFYIERDMQAVIANKPDFTIVYFDWGTDEQGMPAHEQQEMARYVFEKGANLVVATCPNAPMRMDYMNYTQNGMQREGIIAYSLGNLLASNAEIKNRKGYIMDMEIQKNNYTGATKIKDMGVIPVYTYYDTISEPGKERVYTVPCWAVENGEILKGIPYIEKRRIINGAYEIRQMLGATADEIQYNLNELIVNNVMEAIAITSASLNNKFARKEESDIQPAAAPALPVVSESPHNPPSLATIEAQSNTPPKKEKKESNYEKVKRRVEEIFENMDVTSGTRAIERPIDFTTTAIKGISSGLGLQAGGIETLKGTTLKAEADTFYRIQFYTLQRPLPLDTDYYTHLKGYEMHEENGTYRYYLGLYKSYKECYDFWKAQIQPRYRQSFIVKFVYGKRVIE